MSPFGWLRGQNGHDRLPIPTQEIVKTQLISEYNQTTFFTLQDS